MMPMPLALRVFSMVRCYRPIIASGNALDHKADMIAAVLTAAVPVESDKIARLQVARFHPPIADNVEVALVEGEAVREVGAIQLTLHLHCGAPCGAPVGKGTVAECNLEILAAVSLANLRLSVGDGLCERPFRHLQAPSP